MRYQILAIFVFLSALLFNPLQPGFAQEIATTDKLITIDLGSQMLYAWENGQIVYQTAISSGLPQSPTVRGTFRIYSKIPSQRMIGVSPVNGRYDHPNVPNVMYFYGAYGIHGAYWHNNFGNMMSNGCVNLPLDAAAWMYNFAPNGTKVVVY